MTDPNPGLISKKKIKDAIFRAAAIKGGPVGYGEIMQELPQGVNPESLSRWLRSMANMPNSNIIKRGPGLYTVTRVQYDNSLGMHL